MANPVIEATALTEITSATTNHEIDLPADIEVGELLLVLFGAPDMFGTEPEGWDREIRLNHSTVSGVSRVYVWTRTADGTEGSTITFTSGASFSSSAAAYRISGADSVEITSQAESGGAGSPDPPSLTPSGGAADILWFAICGVGGHRTIDSAPTNYGSFLNPSTGVGAGEASLAGAARSLNASSEDPGVFTLSGASEWVALTMAVKPAAAAGPAPTDVVAANPTSTSIDVTWTDGEAVPHMVSYRETAVGGVWTLFATEAAGTEEATVTGLDPSIEYDIGVSTLESDVVFDAQFTAPAAPTGVTTLRFEWGDDGGVSSHRIYFRETGSGDPWTLALTVDPGVTETPVYMDNSTPRVAHDYAVSAYDAVNDVESDPVLVSGSQARVTHTPLTP